MSRTIYQYQPINETPDQAIGISLPFNKSSARRLVSGNYASGSIGAGSVFNSTFTTEEQVISNLKNLLLTRKGERLMQPNFGTNIQDSLFQPNTRLLVEELKSSITDDITFWLPYIEIIDIDVIRSTDNNAINIQLQFRVSDLGANQVINVLVTENELILSDVGVA